MLEQSLYDPIIKGARLDNWLLYRIVDGSVGKKPFDISGTTNEGIAIAIEAKVYRSNIPINWDRVKKLLEPHQWNWLKAYFQFQAIALIPVYIESEKRFVVYRPDGSNYELVRVGNFWRGWKR